MHLSVGRKKINEEQMPARLPLGTLARMDSVLTGKEKRSDLLREAIERELARRERKPKRRAKPKA
jgi:metal-responsive CopG/Arc/MetJ family transcriptional regulator